MCDGTHSLIDSSLPDNHSNSFQVAIRIARHSGAVPRSTDDRLRTRSFPRVADYTSISLINGYAGAIAECGV